MKHRNLLYALLALPLVFAACEPEPDQAPKSYDLKVTSEAVMNFEAEGGQGVITFELEEVTRFSPVPEPVVEAFCEAEWVTDITVSENITFNVAANLAEEARETKVVVTYGEQEVEVAVKQAADQVDGPKDYTMDVELAGAYREPSAEFGLDDNYFLLGFADDAENVELGLCLVGAEGETILSAGQYTDGDENLVLDECAIIVWEPAAAYSDFASGNVVVSVEDDIYTFDITLISDIEEVFHFTYEGTVMDMEPAERPEPETFSPIYVEAYRSSGWDIGNFELDLYINDELYHSLDMQDNVNPNENYLSEGRYTMENGGVTSWSNFVQDLETGEGAFVTDADITLTHHEDGTTTIEGYFESEYGDHLDISWTGVVVGFNFEGETPDPTPGEGVVFNAPYFACEYYSAGSMGTPANNYWVILSDDEACNTQNPAPGATYMVLDLYSDLEQGSLPLGTYTFDINDSGEANTMGFYYSYGLVMSASSEPQEWYVFSAGTVTVTEGKIVAELTREEDGSKVTVTYEGDLTFGNGGGSEGGDEGGSGDGYVLEGDLDINITGASIEANYYGDWYGVGADLWWISIVEDDANMSGNYLQFELLVDPAYDDWRGTFTALNDESTSYFAKFVPGSVENGSMAGAWFAEIDGGNISGECCAIADGTVEFVFNEDGTYSVVLDCVDAAGNKITGTVTSAATASTFAAPMSVGRAVVNVKNSRF